MVLRYINQTQQRLAVAHASGGGTACDQRAGLRPFLGGPEALSKDQKRIEHRVKNHHDDLAAILSLFFGEM